MTGFFAIGIERCKTHQNLGSLWRSANLYGASFIFTVGRRYSPRKDVGLADTMSTHKSIPLMHFDDPSQLITSLPRDCALIGVEIHETAKCIREFQHLPRACYVLGAEDYGLSKDMRERCHGLVRLPGRFSMNVAAAGSIVMHDRWHKSTDDKDA